MHPARSAIMGVLHAHCESAEVSQRKDASLHETTKIQWWSDDNVSSHFGEIGLIRNYVAV